MASLLEDAASDYRTQMLAQDDATLRELSRLWLAGATRLDDQILALTRRAEAARAQGIPVGQGWLQAEGRLEALLTQVFATVSQFSGAAGDVTWAAQRQAINQAQADAARLIAAARVAAGVTSIPESTARFHDQAARELAARLGDGGPTHALLTQLAPLAVVAVKDRLVAGLIAGDGSAVTARAVSDDLGVGLSRAQTIARTTTLGAYRAATIDTYRANADVVARWRWVASKSMQTCGCCLALDGHEFPIDDPFGSHPNCRCTPVPVTRGYGDPEADALKAASARQYQTGTEWIEARSPRELRRQFGIAKGNALATHEITPLQLVGYRDDPTWGPTRWERSMKAIREDRDDVDPLVREVLHPVQSPMLPPVSWVNITSGVGVDDLAREIFGQDMSPDQLADLTGADRAGSTANLHVTYNQLHNEDVEGIEINVQNVDAGYGMTRTLMQGPDGPKIYNNYFAIDDIKAQGHSLGTRLFSNQVARADAAGVTEIETYAAGSMGSSQNGYYTWARLGYNLKLDRLAQKEAALAGFDGVVDTHGLFEREGGAEWWEEYGHTTEATFDPRAGSTSRQALEGYLQGRGLETELTPSLEKMSESLTSSGLASERRITTIRVSFDEYDRPYWTDHGKQYLVEPEDVATVNGKTYLYSGAKRVPWTEYVEPDVAPPPIVPPIIPVVPPPIIPPVGPTPDVERVATTIRVHLTADGRRYWEDHGRRYLVDPADVVLKDGKEFLARGATRLPWTEPPLPPVGPEPIVIKPPDPIIEKIVPPIEPLKPAIGLDTWQKGIIRTMYNMGLSEDEIYKLIVGRYADAFPDVEKDDISTEIARLRSEDPIVQGTGIPIAEGTPLPDGLKIFIVPDPDAKGELVRAINYQGRLVEFKRAYGPDGYDFHTQTTLGAKTGRDLGPAVELAPKGSKIGYGRFIEKGKKVDIRYVEVNGRLYALGRDATFQGGELASDAIMGKDLGPAPKAIASWHTAAKPLPGTKGEYQVSWGGRLYRVSKDVIHDLGNGRFELNGETMLYDDIGAAPAFKSISADEAIAKWHEIYDEAIAAKAKAAKTYFGIRTTKGTSYAELLKRREQLGVATKAVHDAVQKFMNEVVYLGEDDRNFAPVRGIMEPSGRTASFDFQDRANKAIDDLQRMVRSEKANGIRMSIIQKADDFRSCQGGYQLNISRDDPARVFIHEAGHWLEEHDPRFKARAEAFLRRRTAGEQVQKLKDLINQPYEDTEVTKPDKFINPYIGKWYEKDVKGTLFGTEVHSMGLDLLYSDPQKLIEEDPDMFKFIWDSMRGIPDQDGE
jgi:SPP1 gp7 family putative phage head morphogenesis protein